MITYEYADFELDRIYTILYGTEFFILDSFIEDYEFVLVNLN
jgi:hypothetical protein